MGFVLKTTFWLGLVFSAMPLGESGRALLSPAEQAAACATATSAISARVGSGADPYRALAELGCATLANATPAAIAAAPASAPWPPARQTLSVNDRKPPWLGPPLPPVRRKSG
jgi:hypothetical protein